MNNIKKDLEDILTVDKENTLSSYLYTSTNLKTPELIKEYHGELQFLKSNENSDKYFIPHLKNLENLLEYIEFLKEYDYILEINKSNAKLESENNMKKSTYLITSHIIIEKKEDIITFSYLKDQTCHGCERLKLKEIEQSYSQDDFIKLLS